MFFFLYKTPTSDCRAVRHLFSIIMITANLTRRLKNTMMEWVPAVRAHFGEPTSNSSHGNPPSSPENICIHSPPHNLTPIVYEILFYRMCCTRFVFTHVSCYVIIFSQLNKKKNLSIPYVFLYYYYFKSYTVSRSRVIHVDWSEKDRKTCSAVFFALTRLHLRRFGLPRVSADLFAAAAPQFRRKQ